jgi:hypothetical protein
MTVWAKLQSWLGASASDVAIDNEFNNIYLGLNEAANGNLPSGYNKVGLTFTGASLTIKGETKIGNTNVPLDSALTVSGLAGWRYIVTTNGGVMSVESIPGAEITADTQVYTPTPVFNVANNGYYSTVNTARRIVGICYFDTTIKEVIAYGDGKKRNDDYWRNAVSGTGELSTAGERLQFSDAMLYSRGSNITIVDNGYGSTDAYGCKITNLENSEIKIAGSITIKSAAASAVGVVSLYKNGQVFINDLVSAYLEGANSYVNIPFSVTDKHSQANDYYTFVVNVASSTGITLLNIEVTK